MRESQPLRPHLDHAAPTYATGSIKIHPEVWMRVQQMDWLHPADHDRSWRTPHRPPDRDVLTDLDAAVLFHAHHVGSVSPHDRDSPEWATAIAGLIGSGLLVHTDANSAVLSDDVQYGLRLIDSDETTN
ncbi:hypothetical protein AB0D54_37360 [Streptomyces xanthophaeus]|uniref:hypothetical protein n=1 Tax=Streptomyces xanthophaeus TaxID=67385 RepID=UPI003431AEAF